MISVITPTYNRAYILPQCYESLCKQTNPEFEWIVVDDGSTDNTEELINGFIQEGKIKIKYYNQPNGGKHRAHNLAVDKCSGELCVCLDSDDMLAPNAVEKASMVWTTSQENNCIGILALRGDLESHKPICSSVPYGVSKATMSELRDVYGFEGDTVLFFNTQILKTNKFKEFEGEKFLTEGNLYTDLDRLGYMILIDEVLYYCEYRPDGLTAKYHKLLYDNPKGSADTYYKMSLIASSYKTKLKYAIISQAYNNLITPAQRVQYSKNKITMALAKIMAPLFSFKYLRRFK